MQGGGENAGAYSALFAGQAAMLRLDASPLPVMRTKIAMALDLGQAGARHAGGSRAASIILAKAGPGGRTPLCAQSCRARSWRDAHVWAADVRSRGAHTGRGRAHAAPDTRQSGRGYPPGASAGARAERACDPRRRAGGLAGRRRNCRRQSAGADRSTGRSAALVRYCWPSAASSRRHRRDACACRSGTRIRTMDIRPRITEQGFTVDLEWTLRW